MKVKTSPYHPIRRIQTPVEDQELLMFNRKVISPHLVEYTKIPRPGAESARRISDLEYDQKRLYENRKRKAVKSVTAMKKTTDHKNDPAHYTGCTIEPIEFVLANNLGPCEANVVKYVTRWKQKDGIKDLRKAIRYLELLIEHEDYKGKTKKARNG